MKTVVIGCNSYLGSGYLASKPEGIEVCALSHSNWKAHAESLLHADCVINFALSPRAMQHEMEEDEILDIELARFLKNSQARFILVSSRKVYGMTTELVRYQETHELPTQGGDPYTRNKRKTEAAVQGILGDRTVILRVPNIIGTPVLRGDYGTFVGWITKSFVRTGKLFCNQPPGTVKDFITPMFLHKAITGIILKGLTGIYNVSSNLNIDIETLLGENVGRENLVFENVMPAEQFLLDNSKLARDSGIWMNTGELLGKAQENRKLLEQWRYDYLQLATDAERRHFFVNQFSKNE